MARRGTIVQKIVRLTSEKFPSLHTSIVDPEELVRFILTKRNAIERASHQKLGDDARDYMNHSHLFTPLSNKALGEIKNIRPRDIRRRLKEKAYPFSKLNRRTRKILLHLPSSWIYGASSWLIYERQTLKRRSE